MASELLPRVSALIAHWRDWADKIYRVEAANRIRDCADHLSVALHDDLCELNRRAQPQLVVDLVCSKCGYPDWVCKAILCEGGELIPNEDIHEPMTRPDKPSDGAVANREPGAVVARYSLCTGGPDAWMGDRTDGDYVAYEDYEAMRARAEALQNALRLIAASRVPATGFPPVPDLSAEMAWGIARAALAEQERGG